ncbi:DNA-binding transcriptional regulator YdaS, prophage-encoded, Cro superfamily [Moraxella cuniculi DSM 21768]|uniref:DNA-binding transcriptional regulator YdaS, prophage-encoded, Cro superfamily n=1 Tax=Moraxella cuniculi DSM 21768 TaxID=1122245 RepID=A0A1N7G6K9_9GAMM|nr:Cro/CI family transcriptional regulator [Moraxella cuniculi]OOS04358.1 Cro/Cl family transcriptional regulator [Moraxella cuniculi]SIS08243.1 DNA-binding transcriptional regulator YdaS, prophage-encoded, Cro superfamily [Moraxella cuniculi DSM 21768]
MTKTPLEQAFAIVGNRSALARAIGVTPWAVSKWDINNPPKKRCLAIEKATGGKITAEQLRPDINWQYVRSCQAQ